MKIDLNTGAAIEIGGELGKYNSIPIDVLVKAAQDLQDLIYAIAKYDLPQNQAVDPDNFKIELVGFSKGSAVPKFAFSQRSETKASILWEVQRNAVNKKFDKLISISNTGEYNKLMKLYPQPAKRNPIVSRLYEFVNDFGSAPVSFVTYDSTNKKRKSLYKITRFKSAVKDTLITEPKNKTEIISESTDAVGRIKITIKKGKPRRRILNTYTDKNFSLEYAPKIIIKDMTTYFLKCPLRCLFEKENDYYIIQSELLGVIGTGLTESEAQRSFSIEFDYLYNRLQTLEDTALTKHNLFIKNVLTQYVDRIEQ